MGDLHGCEHVSQGRLQVGEFDAQARGLGGLHLVVAEGVRHLSTFRLLRLLQVGQAKPFNRLVGPPGGHAEG